MKRNSIQLITALLTITSGASFIGGAAWGDTIAGNSDSLSLDFSTFTPGDLPGSGTSDVRTPGDGANWYYPDNAATSGQITTDPTTENNALLIYNNGNGNDGVVNNVVSPKLQNLAGQTGAQAQPGATANDFTSTFVFHTVSDTAVMNFQFKSEDWGQDRTTWLSFENDGSGNLVADYSGVTDPTHTTDGDIFTDQVSDPGVFQWGQSYRVTTSVDFGSGPDSDQVNVDVYDASDNSLVWSVTDTTWADYYLYDSEQAPNGNIMTGVDAVQFQMRDSEPGADNGVFISSLSYGDTVPEPASLSLISLGIPLLLRRRRRSV